MMMEIVGCMRSFDDCGQMCFCLLIHRFFLVKLFRELVRHRGLWPQLAKRVWVINSVVEGNKYDIYGMCFFMWGRMRWMAVSVGFLYFFHVTIFLLVCDVFRFITMFLKKYSWTEPEVCAHIYNVSGISL